VAPFLALAVVLVWIASALIDSCPCGVPWAWRLGAQGVVVAAFLIDLSGVRWPRLVFGLAVCIPMAWLNVHRAAWISPLFLVMLVGWVAYTDGRLMSRVVCGLAVLSFAPYILEPDTSLPWSVGFVLVWAAVRVLRAQRELLLELAAAQADLVRQSSAAERRRIAREIHDVIAHSLAVTMLHLTGARYVLTTDPQAAVAALAEAERLGRQSLADVRRTVGLLDADPAENGQPVPPLPGPHDLPKLVADYTRAGLSVRLDMTGAVERLSAAVGLELYRIAEEALANAAKHTSRPRVEVRLDVRDDGSARLRIQDDGGTGNGRTPVVHGGSGMGIPGMRERAALLGGHLVAGPGGLGWLVECVLPNRASDKTDTAELAALSLS
jgi:signal transduction histidine kinase